MQAVFWALMSAVFAAATSLLAKAALNQVNSTLATAIRTVVVLIMAWLMVWITGRQHELVNLSGRTWLFLVLSGIATGLSWLCYFYALQKGNVGSVVAIDKLSVVITLVLAAIWLGEKLDGKAILGGLLMTAGALLLSWR